MLCSLGDGICGPYLEVLQVFIYFHPSFTMSKQQKAEERYCYRLQNWSKAWPPTASTVEHLRFNKFNFAYLGMKVLFKHHQMHLQNVSHSFRWQLTDFLEIKCWSWEQNSFVWWIFYKGHICAGVVTQQQCTAYPAKASCSSSAV